MKATKPKEKKGGFCMKRKISALLVLAMLSGLISGCGTAENSDSSAPSSDAAGESQASSQAATDEEVTIEVRWANIPESTQKGKCIRSV